jgi:hypothetical protein
VRRDLSQLQPTTRITGIRQTPFLLHYCIITKSLPAILRPPRQKQKPSAVVIVAHRTIDANRLSPLLSFQIVIIAALKMCFGGREDVEAKKSREIDALIHRDEKVMQRQVKLLLLGMRPSTNTI